MREELELLGGGADPADITKPTPTLRASVKHSTNTAKPYRADDRAERGQVSDEGWQPPEGDRHYRYGGGDRGCSVFEP